jgi:hypothetical protein
MHQAIREPSIVGDEQEALAVPVKTTDREDPFFKIREQIQVGGAALGIVIGTYDVGGLIHEQVNKGFQLDHLAVHLDPVRAGFHLARERLGGTAIDRNPAVCDELFAGAPGSKATAGQILV